MILTFSFPFFSSRAQAAFLISSAFPRTRKRAHAKFSRPSVGSPSAALSPFSHRLLGGASLPLRRTSSFFRLLGGRSRRSPFFCGGNARPARRDFRFSKPLAADASIIHARGEKINDLRPLFKRKAQRFEKEELISPFPFRLRPFKDRFETTRSVLNSLFFFFSRAIWRIFHKGSGQQTTAVSRSPSLTAKRQATTSSPLKKAEARISICSSVYTAAVMASREFCVTR